MCTYRNTGCGSISSIGCGKFSPLSTKTGELPPFNTGAQVELRLQDSTIPTSIYRRLSLLKNIMWIIGL